MADPVPLGTTVPARRKWWLRTGGTFLLVSILVHVLFGVGAGYMIIQKMVTKPKPTFTASAASAPAAPNREHQVQMQKKQQAMSAPPQLKRITTTAPNPKVALPQMPTLPTTNTSLAPTAMSGMRGAGVSLSMGTVAGSGGGRSGGLNLFGFQDRRGPGLEGTFYDLKQTITRQPTNMTPDLYGKIVVDFVNGGFNAGLLTRFFKSERKVYAPWIWIPRSYAELGPAAFELQNIVQPRMWCVHYRGRVTAPASFTFHFVGAGDDVLFVRFGGKLVLDRGWYVHTNWKSQADYAYDFSPIPHGFAKGDAIKVEAGGTYPIEILIGEQPGGETFATLLQEVEGTAYDKDAKGNPILPVFRMSADLPAASTAERPYPPHRDDGPVWRAEPPEKN